MTFDAITTCKAGGDPDQHLTTSQAAELLAMSASYLNKLRLGTEGPPFRTLGALRGRPDAVRYRRGDLLAWAEARAASSTSERDVQWGRSASVRWSGGGDASTRESSMPKEGEG